MGMDMENKDMDTDTGTEKRKLIPKTMYNQQTILFRHKFYLKKLVVTLLLFAFIITVKAQKISGFIFKSDAYIGANVGLNTFLAEGSTTYSKTQSSGFIGRSTIGYNLSPVIGVRGLMGYASHNWPDFRFRSSDGSLRLVSFDAQMLTVDLTVNLSNWLSYYNRNRTFDLSVFAGTGVTHRNKAAFNNDLISYLGRGGLQGDFHLSSFIDLNLIAETNFTGDNYNNYKVGFLPFDVYTAFTVGLSYHFRSAGAIFSK